MNIVYEDNHIIVVEKPVNTPSQSDKTGDMDLLTMIKEYLKEKYNKPGDAYVGLIHRLDRPVGGVMVYAKTSKAASRLSEQVRNKEFVKKYLAIVDGKVEGNAVLEDYLLKTERTNTSKVVESNVKNAKFASLEYESLYYNSETDLTLLKIKLNTGRHHQIRVQLANMGHAIYGDQKYGKRGVGKQINLWAYEITIKHPITKEEMKFKCLPKQEGSWIILQKLEVGNRRLVEIYFVN